MADVIIKGDLLTKVLTDNLTEILKDVLTGWNSPVKKLLQDENGEVYKALKEVATDVFTKTIKSENFQNELKEKMMEVAIQKMLSK